MNEPKLVYEGKHICPICKNNSLVVKEYIYNAPHVGELELSVWECESCGFRVRDVRPIDSLKPIRLELRVENKNDLNTILYRSAYANIIIPELGIEVLAGETYQGVITTVEGILEIILDQMGSNCEGTEKCKEIEMAKNGEIPFTLMIEDESGLSFIRSEKAKVTQH
ncbi:MAG: ZPR1 zinc finger domain-containing protein [Sulfolobus sp.]